MAPWFTSMSLISPTTLFVAGSISITLSPAELVWTMRTVDACREMAVRMARARARENLVFMAPHFKLPGHVAELLFNAAVRADLVHARLRLLQDQGAAAAPREAAGTRALCDVPRAEHRLPPRGAAEG